VSRPCIWRRGAIIGAIVVVLIALGVSAAPNLPSISRAPVGSEEFMPVSRGYGEPEYVDDEIIVKLKPMIAMHHVADMEKSG
jgi:hypothetical protein